MDPMGNGKGKNGQRISDMIWIYLNHLERAPWRQDDSCERCEKVPHNPCTISQRGPNKTLEFPNFDWRIWSGSKHRKSHEITQMFDSNPAPCLFAVREPVTWATRIEALPSKAPIFPQLTNPRFEIIWQFRTLGNPTWETLGIYLLVN